MKKKKISAHSANEDRCLISCNHRFRESDCVAEELKYCVPGIFEEDFYLHIDAPTDRISRKYYLKMISKK